ncbi:hypothetical protein K458DRAFT_399929 [Lentithecium fluviatile CBS 122367]|uniref:Uncharacterized protein n=1 Tax=Lentithecium fluviatile CBS 122367 TaxID=1168545 RepID=A0A6G1JEW1_9PLEO|nr:hypothetical protein K458DRAFT_399929 [Lentithecium fluviatile CBS 122367]
MMLISRKLACAEVLVWSARWRIAERVGPRTAPGGGCGLSGLAVSFSSRWYSPLISIRSGTVGYQELIYGQGIRSSRNALRGNPTVPDDVGDLSKRLRRAQGLITSSNVPLPTT